MTITFCKLYYFFFYVRETKKKKKKERALTKSNCRDEMLVIAECERCIFSSLILYVTRAEKYDLRFICIYFFFLSGRALKFKRKNCHCILMVTWSCVFDVIWGWGIGGTLNPSYVQLPNFNTHVCSSNGKNSTSISHDDLNMAGGFHSTSPMWYMVALVASVTSKLPSALRIIYTHNNAHKLQHNRRQLD